MDLQNSGPIIRNRVTLLLLCGLMFITTLAFYPSLNCLFANFDDNVLVVRNAAITRLSVDNLAAFFTHAHYGLYHPLVLVSYAVEFHWFGLFPGIYHATNLCLHLLNGLLVFWLFFFLTRRALTAWIVAILFSIHPLHVESVAWISERKDMLYAFFFLGACVSYLYYLKDRQKRHYLATLSLFVLSLLAKPMAITLPAILFLLDWYAGEREKRSAIVDKIPFLVLAAVFALVAVHLQNPVRREHVFWLSHILRAIPQAMTQLYFYAGKTLVPVNLSCLYPPLHGRDIFLAPGGIATGLLLTALIVPAMQRADGRRTIGFGLIFFIVTISPVLNIIPFGLGVPADRYTYLPLLGPFFIASDAFVRIYSRTMNKTFARRAFAIAALATIVGVLSVATWNRCQVWHDSIALWSDVVKKYPSVSVAYTNRGQAYVVGGEYDKACADLDRALRLDPRDQEAFLNRGTIRLLQGAYDQALRDYARTLRLNPLYAEAYSNCGNVFLRKKEYETAMSYYGRALAINPHLSLSHYHLGEILSIQGKYGQALREFQDCLRDDPSDADAYNECGKIYRIQKDFNRALSCFTAALAMNPRSPEAYYNRGTVYVFLADDEKAVRDFDAALALRPDYVEAHAARIAVDGKKTP